MQSNECDALYDYTLSGAFQDTGLGEPIDDLLESGNYPIWWLEWGNGWYSKKNQVPVKK